MKNLIKNKIIICKSEEIKKVKNKIKKIFIQFYLKIMNQKMI